MVQDFHVVRCFRCQSFQVQQVKKAKKWSCKLCGEKQSLLKEFGRGSGADCRRHVQKLNAMRGAKMEEQEAHAWSLWCSPWLLLIYSEQEEEQHTGDQVRPAQVSRWSKYLDTPEEEEEESEEEGLEGRNHLHGNQTISRKRHRPEELGGGRGDEGCPPVQLKRTAVTSSVTSSAAPSGSGSRWGQFLSADSWGAEHPLSGRSQPADTAAAKPRPQLPVSSMFDSGEDFNFDEDFLTF
ncbi:MRN complex-interacting protein isoform X1 [Xiphophorus maculatus]|uniref:MRN complex-interacting protein isoform X1 n=1 Tax=Xiphophorus maculatus TaxID=8083 RepID=UPI000C6E4D1C|nr:MRN complex-interacting protein isoform X1 [Xiphophorus maculatus]